MKTIINTSNAPAPIGPYNQAVLVGDTMYVSGQIALIAESGKMAQATISEEATQVMHNLKVILEEAGMNFGNIVKTTIFLKNMADFSVVNEVYGSFFSVDFPARETVEVARLPKDANVEIACIAVKS